MSVLRGKVTTLMQVCLLSSFFCNFVNHNTMEKDSNNIYLVDRKPRKCPCCGGKVVPILYGEPSSEAFEKADRGEIVLGGCIIFADMPEYQCTGCGAQFRKPIIYRNPEDVIKPKR